MIRKEEDDNGRPKSTNESMRLNPFADLLIHMELEQQANCSGFQLMQVREVACSREFIILQKLLYVSSFQSKNSGGFCDFDIQFSIYDDDYDEYDDE